MDHLDELERLERLRSTGALSDAEFDAHKRAVLNKPQLAKGRWIVFSLIAVGLVWAAYSWSTSRGEHDSTVEETPSAVAGGIPAIPIEEGAGSADAHREDFNRGAPGAAGPSAQFGDARAGQDYSTARRSLVDAGFRPASISRGDEYDLCEGAAACPPFPEVLSCSGTGINECRFAFIAGDDRIAIARAVGEDDDPEFSAVAWADDDEALEVRNRIAGRAAMEGWEP